jgi:hypothetical protein
VTFSADAFTYWTAGERAIPVVDKRPVCPTWREWQHRRQTEDEIRSLLGRYPEADTALITGGPSCLVDFDIDSEAGLEVLRSLGLPETIGFSSTRGSHHDFRSRGSLPTRKPFRPGLDVLADNSYVVVPTSGGREWRGRLEDAILLPQRIEQLIWEQRSHLKNLECRGATQGSRNISLTRLVGRWITIGMADTEILHRAWQFGQICTPPMDRQEIEATVASVKRTRCRSRSAERVALMLCRTHGLKQPVAGVLLGLVAMWGELGRPDPFFTPARMVAEFARCDKDSVPKAMELLARLGVLEIGAGVDPASGRRVATVKFLVDFEDNGLRTPSITPKTPKTKTTTNTSTLNAYVP